MHRPRFARDRNSQHGSLIVFRRTTAHAWTRALEYTTQHTYTFVPELFIGAAADASVLRGSATPSLDLSAVATPFRGRGYYFIIIIIIIIINY